MPKFDDYWFDDYDGRPPHEGEHHGVPHDHPYDDYPHHHHPHPPFDGRRHRPVDMGKVDTTKMHNRYDMFVPYHMPPWGFKFPKLEKAFVPGSTPQEQVAYLLNRVDTMIDYFNHYDDKVWGAYNAVVHSALGNEAYYREITREEGYLADGSTPYTVIHIPYLDRAERPIFLELGLAYNSTTNNGVKENVFEASQNRVADKLIPAFNIADRWEGKAMLKGAPIQSTYTEGKFTLAVTDNGFLKIYPNTVSYDQLNRDRIRNAMGVQGVLINNGAKTPEQYATNGGELLARVGIGMNYETKERLIVIVNGNPTPPNDASVTGATADMLADIFAKYNCTVAVETANNGSAVGMDKGQMIYMPDTATTGVIPTVPSINCYWYITKRRHYHNQYVKDVADLIQKVGQNKWRCEIALQSCDFLKGRVNDLQRDLDAEVQARKDADEQLQNNIDAEAEARRLADVQLQDNIDAETNARIAGDNALDERITDEVSILNARIDTVVDDFNNAIATERQARIDGDNALGTRIDNEVATINTRIDSEVATLNALIDAEEQARIAGDTALQNSLTQLREDYTAFLTTYANDLAETRRITTALRSDISIIQGQIAELQSNLSAVNASITAILATINTIEQSFENIKTAFTELQEDWHDYKDSVDAEIAQLMQDIADLNSQTHDTVADMKADTNLKTGMYVRTGGYYTVNDGGGALYRINNIAPSTYYETLSNGLYAILILEEVICPEQFGAKGDGTTDDTSAFAAMIASGKKYIALNKNYAFQSVSFTGCVIAFGNCIINGTMYFDDCTIIGGIIQNAEIHLNDNNSFSVREIKTNNYTPIYVDGNNNEINNVKFTATGDITNAELIYNKGDQNSVSDCSFYSGYLYGIKTCGNNTKIHGCHFLERTTADNSSGIKVTSNDSGVIPEHIVISACDFAPIGTGDCIDLFIGCRDVVIENCTLDNNGELVIDCKSFDYERTDGYNTDATVLKKCIIKNNVIHGYINVISFVSDPSNYSIYVHDVIIEGNLFLIDGSGANLGVVCGTVGQIVRNNIFHVDDANGAVLRFDTIGNGLIFSDNIIDGVGTMFKLNTGINAPNAPDVFCEGNKFTGARIASDSTGMLRIRSKCNIYKPSGVLFFGKNFVSEDDTMYVDTGIFSALADCDFVVVKDGNIINTNSLMIRAQTYTITDLYISGISKEMITTGTETGGAITNETINTQVIGSLE